MEESKFLTLEMEIVNVLKSIFDPEIPVNIYDLGLIYEIEVDDANNVEIEMTLTAPNCPMADDILREVNDKVGMIQLVNKVNINLVFEPTWTKDMLSDEARLELGLM